MKDRNSTLDFLRGVAIIIVVFGHTIQVCFGNPNHPLHIVIQTFQMSLLFVISGFSLGFSEPIICIKKFLFNKIKRIFIPYICWSQINYILTSVVYNDYNFYKHIKNPLISQFWFLRILFLMYIVFALYYVTTLALEKITKHKITTLFFSLIVCFVSLLLLSFIPGCKSILTYFPFFLLGNVLYKTKEIFSKKWVSFLSLFSQLFLSVIFLFSCLLLFKTQGIIRTLIDKSMSVSGCVFCFFICSKLCKVSIFKKFNAFIISLGKNTLPIYAIHWCIFFSLPIPFYQMSSSKIGVLPASLIVCTVWMSLCVLLILLLRKHKIFRISLLGEK